METEYRSIYGDSKKEKQIEKNPRVVEITVRFRSFLRSVLRVVLGVVVAPAMLYQYGRDGSSTRLYRKHRGIALVRKRVV